MPDITIIQRGNGLAFDWSLADGDLQTGNDLETAVIVSLFTDAYSPQALGQDGRGWWGDILRDHPIGSRLWTLRRAKKTAETLRKAEDYTREALRHLVHEDVAQSINVRAYWYNDTGLGLVVDIVQPTGDRSRFEYAWAWGSV